MVEQAHNDSVAEWSGGAIVATEDDLYRHWRDASDAQERSDFENVIFAAILQHVKKIIWLDLQEQNNDLAHTIAGNLVLALPTFRGESKFSTWVHASARNQVKQELRTRICHRKVFDKTVRLSELDPDDSRLSDYYVPQDPITGLMVHQIGSQLSREDAVLLSEVLAGKDQNELAEQFQITPHAAESRRRRMIARLKKILAR